MPERIIELEPEVREKMLRFHWRLKESEATFRDLLRRQCEEAAHQHLSERNTYELLPNGSIRIT